MGVNTDNAKKFTLAVQKVADQLQTDFATEARRLALTIFSRVVLRTPIDDGLLRNNWQLSLNVPSDVVKTTADKSGGTAITEGQQALALFSVGDGIWLSNNLPYAAVWEYGTFMPPNPGPSSDPRPGRKGEILVVDGYSLQAPTGMLGVTIEEVIGGIL